MSAQLLSVRLGEVLRPSDRAVLSSALPEANLAGIYSFGRGLFRRGPMHPAETSYKTYNRLVAEDFVISQPKAWEGALARVTPDFDGWFLSPVFPTFTANAERLLPAYLEWFCKRKALWQELKILSKGMGARRETVSPEQFLSLEIPLPPLGEQRRIVARIEELAAKVEEARRLRKQLEQETSSLPRAILSSDRSGNRIRVGEFATLRSPDVTVEPNAIYNFAGVYSFGRGVFRGQQKMGSEFSYRRLTRLRAGDFVYPKLMAWEGALGIVPPECDQLVVSTEFPVFEINEKLVLPEVLDTYFRSPEVWPRLSGQSGGTNVRRRRLNPQDFLICEMPYPDQDTQRVIRHAVAQLSAVKRLQAETAAELDAMIPAILDKAFKGEL